MKSTVQKSINNPIGPRKTSPKHVECRAAVRDFRLLGRISNKLRTAMMAITSCSRPMHSSNIFLPLLPSHFSLDYHEDPFDKPGAATADAVRYLRYNHMTQRTILTFRKCSTRHNLNSLMMEVFIGSMYRLWFSGVACKLLGKRSVITRSL